MTREKEAAWHKKARRQRSADRFDLKLAKAAARLDRHHGSRAPNNPNILTGPRTPNWTRQHCGECSNFRSRIKCRTCNKDASQQIVKAARAADAEAKAGTLLEERKSGVSSGRPAPWSQEALRKEAVDAKVEVKRLSEEISRLKATPESQERTRDVDQEE